MVKEETERTMLQECGRAERSPASRWPHLSPPLDLSLSLSFSPHCTSLPHYLKSSISSSSSLAHALFAFSFSLVLIFFSSPPFLLLLLLPERHCSSRCSFSAASLFSSPRRDGEREREASPLAVPFFANPHSLLPWFSTALCMWLRPQSLSRSFPLSSLSLYSQLFFSLSQVDFIFFSLRPSRVLSSSAVRI